MPDFSNPLIIASEVENSAIKGHFSAVVLPFDARG